nr:MAG TPA: hypothetical protein [Caudoviricetes sp.]DAF75186.1 MAG TPA: hypothetical protein [Caudoviricetes sp.]
MCAVRSPRKTARGRIPARLVFYICAHARNSGLLHRPIACITPMGGRHGNRSG